MIVPLDENFARLVIDAVHRLDQPSAEIDECPLCCEPLIDDAESISTRLCERCLKIAKSLWVAGHRGNYGNA